MVALPNEERADDFPASTVNQVLGFKQMKIPLQQLSGHYIGEYCAFFAL